ALERLEAVADQWQQNAQRHKEGEVAERVAQAESSYVWMLVGIPEEARERIAKRNYVYVIGTRVPKTGDASRNNRKGKNNADVDNQSCDEKLRFVGSRQASDRIQKTRGRRQELEPKKAIFH